MYAGDTALHVAAFAHDTDVPEPLLACGADVRARNRRGAEPLHAAVIGVPGSAGWDPQRQVTVIRMLIGAGADPNASARLTTGQGGSCSPEARAEQEVIVRLLSAARR